MSAETSPILDLPYIQPSQAQKHVTHNEALRRLDVLVQTVVTDRDRTEPPADPVAGQCHIVAPSGSNEWAGQDHAIACFDGAAWRFTAPEPGWSAQILADGGRAVFDGTGWALDSGTGTAETLGINTTADTVNRLAIAADATLLTHDGAGHQLKLNKAAGTDTASLLFQTDWSGRAEMGTAGSDAFAIKVSADGSGWTTGLSIDPATGSVALPAGATVDGTLSGQAVQQSADDVTPGRLMRADFGYGPGNLLGAVSMTGQLPSGAVIERGSNGNGDYVRFADGTQICIQTLNLSYESIGALSASWTYPAAFTDVQGPFLSGMIDGPSFGANVAGPRQSEVLDIRFGSITGNAAVPRILRISGLTDFTASDNVDCRLFAFGRWD